MTRQNWDTRGAKRASDFKRNRAWFDPRIRRSFEKGNGAELTEVFGRRFKLRHEAAAIESRSSLKIRFASKRQGTSCESRTVTPL
jgi:hypothetical protein